MTENRAVRFTSMQITSLVFGILAVIGMFIAFIPCLGWFNWFNVPFACIGLTISIVSVTIAKKNENRGFSIAGIACCSTAIVLGIIRLIIGAGII